MARCAADNILIAGIVECWIPRPDRVVLPLRLGKPDTIRSGVLAMAPQFLNLSREDINRLGPSRMIAIGRTNSKLVVWLPDYECVGTCRLYCSCRTTAICGEQRDLCLSPTSCGNLPLHTGSCPANPLPIPTWHNIPRRSSNST